MSYLAAVQKSADPAPPIILIHGPPGSWKTQMCVDAIKSLGGLMLLTEKSLGNRDVDHLKLTSLQMLYDVIKELGTTEHKYKVLAIDTLDHLAPLVAKAVCEANQKPNLRSFGYGKGEEAEAEEWHKIFLFLETLAARKQMVILLTAHSQVRTVEDPALNDGYPRWEIKLPKKVGPVCKEKADILGCVLPKVFVKENEDGKARAIGDGGFQLHLGQRPSIDAKNRYGITTSPIDMSWDVLWTAFNNANAKASA